MSRETEQTAEQDHSLPASPEPEKEQEAETHDRTITMLLAALSDCLAYEAKAAEYSGLVGCTCINQSRDAERAYDMGTCPHQIANALVAELFPKGRYFPCAKDLPANQKNHSLLGEAQSVGDPSALLALVKHLREMEDAPGSVEDLTPGEVADRIEAALALLRPRP